MDLERFQSFSCHPVCHSETSNKINKKNSALSSSLLIFWRIVHFPSYPFIINTTMTKILFQKQKFNVFLFHSIYVIFLIFLHSKEQFSWSHFILNLNNFSLSILKEKKCNLIFTSSLDLLVYCRNVSVFFPFYKCYIHTTIYIYIYMKSGIPEIII